MSDREDHLRHIKSMTSGRSWDKDVPTDKLETIFNILKEHE